MCVCVGVCMWVCGMSLCTRDAHTVDASERNRAHWSEEG